MKDTGPRSHAEQRTRAKKLRRLGATERKVVDYIVAKHSFWSHGFVTMSTEVIVQETGCLDGAVRRAMRSLRRKGLLVYADRRTAHVGPECVPIWAGPYLRPAHLPPMPEDVLSIRVLGDAWKRPVGCIGVPPRCAGRVCRCAGVPVLPDEQEQHLHLDGQEQVLDVDDFLRSFGERIRLNPEDRHVARRGARTATADAVDRDVSEGRTGGKTGVGQDLDLVTRVLSARVLGGYLPAWVAESAVDGYERGETSVATIFTGLAEWEARRAGSRR